MPYCLQKAKREYDKERSEKLLHSLNDAAKTLRNIVEQLNALQGSTPYTLPASNASPLQASNPDSPSPQPLLLPTDRAAAHREQVRVNVNGQVRLAECRGGGFSRIGAVPGIFAHKFGRKSVSVFARSLTDWLIGSIEFREPKNGLFLSCGNCRKFTAVFRMTQYEWRECILLHWPLKIKTSVSSAPHVRSSNFFIELWSEKSI